jgi:lysophospholipase L1-like esterase
MRRLLSFALLLLAGCGAPPKSPESPNDVGYGGPRGEITAPSVVLVGDSTVTAWCAAGVPANWTCQASQPGQQETTTQILARFGSATTLHPQVIVIEAGVWDMLAASPQFGVAACDASDACTNIQQMITEATNAGSYVIVCTIPPWGQGPAATSTSSEEDLQHIFEDVPGLNTAIMADTAGHADINAALVWNDPPSDDDQYYLFPYEYNPAYTTDGVNPNTAGAQAMTAVLQAAITKANIKGTR